jgi:hypothetical protein
LTARLALVEEALDQARDDVGAAEERAKAAENAAREIGDLQAMARLGEITDAEAHERGGGIADEKTAADAALEHARRVVEALERKALEVERAIFERRLAAAEEASRAAEAERSEAERVLGAREAEAKRAALELEDVRASEPGPDRANRERVDRELVEWAARHADVRVRVGTVEEGLREMTAIDTIPARLRGRAHARREELLADRRAVAERSRERARAELDAAQAPRLTP